MNTKDRAASADTEPLKKKKKLPVILGVAAAVLLIAGAGLFVWHEQPSFCGAICHTPMDPYLDTYEQEYGTEGTDKWGNEVKSTNGMLVVSHKAALEENGDSLTCLSCHIPTMSEQVNEGFAWISGNYEVVDNATYGLVLHETSLDDLTAASGNEPDTFCLNEACHENDDGSVMTREDLVVATSDMTLNPHEMPHNELACSDCHKAHRASVNSCTQCHNDAKVPEGWISVSQEKQLSATD